MAKNKNNPIKMPNSFFITAPPNNPVIISKNIQKKNINPSKSVDQVLLILEEFKDTVKNFL